MNQNLYADYNDAIGSVMAARSRYQAACVAQGPGSWAAHQAHEYLEREIVHRNEVRTEYDAATHHRTGT